MRKKETVEDSSIGSTARAVGIELESSQQSPQALLARLMDLRGSVAISGYLNDEFDHVPAEPSSPSSVRGMATRCYADVRTKLQFSTDNAFRARYRLPNAARAWSMLDSKGALAAFRSGKKRERAQALRVASRLLWGPFGEFVETRLKRARFALRDLREEISGPLAGLGDAASQIERLDHALRNAVEAEVTHLYQRIGHWSQLAFSSRLEQALLELPDVAFEDAFALGFSQDGWLGELFSQAMSLVSSVIEYEISQIENLIESAITAHHDGVQRTD